MPTRNCTSYANQPVLHYWEMTQEGIARFFPSMALTEHQSAGSSTPDYNPDD